MRVSDNEVGMVGKRRETPSNEFVDGWSWSCSGGVRGEIVRFLSTHILVAGLEEFGCGANVSDVTATQCLLHYTVQ